MCPRIKSSIDKLIWDDGIIFVGNYMWKAVVDDKGRVLIPSKIRRRLNLKKGTELEIKIIDGNIVLTRIVPKIRKAKANREWGEEAFLDAGEATFGEY